MFCCGCRLCRLRRISSVQNWENLMSFWVNFERMSLLLFVSEEVIGGWLFWWNPSWFLHQIIGLSDNYESSITYMKENVLGTNMWCSFKHGELLVQVLIQHQNSSHVSASGKSFIRSAMDMINSKARIYFCIITSANHMFL